MSGGVPAGHRQFNLALPDDYVDVVEALAESSDLPTTTWLSALVVGVLKNGQAERMVSIGLPSIPETRRKRRPRRNPRKWVAVYNEAIEGPQAATWVSGEYRLVRLGRVQVKVPDTPDDGWYLEGPGFDHAEHLGFRRRDEAIRRAEELIRIHEANT